MARDLNVTNHLDQTIKVFVWERTGWKFLDYVVEGQAVVSASTDIAAAVDAAPEFVGALAAITTVEEALAFMNRGWQATKGIASFVTEKAPNILEFAEALQSTFESKTVAVAPNATVQIMELSTWHDLISPDGIAAILGAETVGMFVIAADRSRMVHFQSNPEASWSITASGAQDSVSGRSVPWDGSAIAQHRPALTTVVLAGDDNDKNAALYAPWLFWRDADSSIQAMEFLGGFWNKYPHPAVMTSFSAPAAAFHHTKETIVVAGVTADQNQTAQYAVTANFGTLTGEHGPIFWQGGVSGGVSLTDEPGGSTWALVNFNNGTVGNVGYDGPGIAPNTWGPMTMMFDIPTDSCPSLVSYRGRFYLSWIARGDATGKLLFGAMSEDRSSVENPTQIPGAASQYPPALAVFQDKLYAVWMVSDTQSLLWMSAFDGSTWTPPRIVPGFAPGGPPALTATGHYMLMTCSSPAPYNVIMFSISSDGTTWDTPHVVPVQGPHDDAGDPLDPGHGAGNTAPSAT
jgi:hypothetical protein